MKKKFNHTIAYKRRDKGFKACYRYMTYDSCIYDSSYYHFAKIELDKTEVNAEELVMTENSFSHSDKVFSVLKTILNKFSLNNNENFEFFKCYVVNLYNLTGNLIGPTSLILFPNSILVKYHPLMKNEIESLLNSFSCGIKVSFNISLCDFSLIGPQSSSILYKVLKSLKFDDDENQNNIFADENFEKEIQLMKNGSTILFKIKKPESQFKINASIIKKLTAQLCQRDNTVNSDINMKENFGNLVSKSNEIFYNTFLDKLKIKINRDRIVEFPTERTQFQHRKKTDLDKINKKIKSSIVIKKSLNYSNKIQNKKTNNFENIDPENLQKYITSDEETYILLIKNNITKIENGRKIIYPTFNLVFEGGYSINLFKRFVFLESRPIGLCELNYFLKTTNNFIFPNDYPSTDSYRRYITEKTIKKIYKYTKYPASKRVNYQKLANPFPFYPSWRRLKSTNTSFEFSNFNLNVNIINDITNKNKIKQQLILQNIQDTKLYTFIIPVNIEMVGEGVPEYNSLICLPDENDIKDFINNRNTKGGLTGTKLMNYFSKTNTLNNNFLSEDLFQMEKEKILMKKSHISETVQKNDVIKNKVFNIEYSTIKSMIESNTLNSSIYNSDILETDLTVKLKSSPERKIIGFITSGCYSFSDSKGLGRGYINTDAYEDLLKLKEKSKNKENLFVLIRKPTSLIYYPARLNILSI